MGQHRLDAVLGQHRHAAVRPEVELAETVGDTVERLADLCPTEDHPVVAERHLGRALSGERAGDQDHQTTLRAEGRPKEPSGTSAVIQRPPPLRA